MNEIIFWFDPFLEARAEKKNVQFFVQMMPKKFASEINWPLETHNPPDNSHYTTLLTNWHRLSQKNKKIQDLLTGPLSGK